MNIIIYTVLILATLYILLKFFAGIASKKISKGIRILLFIGLIMFAILFAIAGKFLLTLPFTILRPHNFYGPRMGQSHVIPELFKKVYYTFLKYEKKIINNCKFFANIF